jgi:hypothetical protein
MMFAVLVTYCMLQSPAECVERAIPLHGANELTCYSVGQAEAVKALLPGWRITRYGCRRA